jgi:general secretion pathway protein H
MRHRPRQRGFTLLELLVVFAIGALLVGLVPIAFEKLKESSQYRDTLRVMLSDIRTARQTAITRGEVAQFVVDLSQRAYGVAGGKLRVLPPGLIVNATVAAQALSKEQTASVYFYPDGGGTGGSYEIIRPSGSGARLVIDWLTGHVSQTPIAQ